jgi:hypothetical protein
MRRSALLLVSVVALAGVLVGMGSSSREADEDAASISAGKLPPAYRDWRLISVAHEEGDFKSFAAVLGNDVAIKAFREGRLPFPDGIIIAALHWRHVPSEENNKVFGRSQSFVAGPATNVQLMVKDSTKYAATDGWWFAQFDDGKPLTDKAKLKSCFDCHALNKVRDLVFTKYAP